jgi:glycosyltransferase involved in cell wall biosynthesis
VKDQTAAPPTGAPRLGIVIPARNEAARIGDVLAHIEKVPGIGSHTVLVVDDGSGDDTARIAREGGATVVRHVVNIGKGGALRTGCELALRRGCEVIAVMDADGQHDPGDLPRLVAPLLAGEADIVCAYRHFTADMPAAMRLGNHGLSRFFHVLFGIRVTDTQCGFRAFAAKTYEKVRWQATDYSVETEMLVRAARAHLRLREIEIATIYHDHYKGTTPLDGLKIFASMLMWRVGL